MTTFSISFRPRFTLDLFGRSWVKLWTTRTLTDAKIRRCNGSQRNLFFTCLMFAGESDSGGRLITGSLPITDDEVLAASGDTKAIAKRSLAHIIALGLVERCEGVLMIPNFERAQETPAAARTRKWRGQKERYTDARCDGHGDAQKTEDIGEKKYDAVATDLQRLNFTKRQTLELLKLDRVGVDRWIAWLDSSPPDPAIVNKVAYALSGMREGRKPPELSAQPPPPVTQEQFMRFGAEATRLARGKYPAAMSTFPAAVEDEIRRLVAEGEAQGAA